jgi:hypothetical protein
MNSKNDSDRSVGLTKRHLLGEGSPKPKSNVQSPRTELNTIEHPPIWNLVFNWSRPVKRRFHTVATVEFPQPNSTQLQSSPANSTNSVITQNVSQLSALSL